MAEIRLRRIDASNIADHARLDADDECYFVHEYTSGQSFGFGDANDLISNLKKPMDRRGRPEFKWKTRAINRSAELLRITLNAKWLETGTLVPVPPSKAKGDPLYDDRLLQICRGIGPNVDVREIVQQAETIRAAHESEGNRPSVAELVRNYRIDEACCDIPRPVRSIAIVDDVLTAGTHYRAMHQVLSRRFPAVPVIGLFVARRVFAKPSES